MSSIKKIVNPHEQVAYQELESLADEYGYNIHVKVRLADVVSIEGSGLNDALFGFALKSHLDFLVCNESHDPLFAVEFDGPSHQETKQRDRDARKNAICDRFGLPILRINTNHLLKKYNKASLLKWIISAWELQKAFNEAQQKGQVPEYEDFDPIFLWHSGNTIEEIHPHWIALKARRDIETLHKQGRLPVARSCQFIFIDDDGNYRGIEWIDVDGGKVIAVESAMREQQFPVYLGDLFREIMTVLLYDRLVDFLNSDIGSVEPATIAARVAEWDKRYHYAGSFTAPSCVNASISFTPQRWIGKLMAEKSGQK
jgi:hypothetical protein